MVQHAGADDLIERLTQLADVFDRKPAEVEILQFVFSLKVAACGRGSLR